MIESKSNTIIDEYALRDTTGIVKPEIQDMVYQNLKLKDMPTGTIPGYFKRQIKNGDTVFGDFTIQEIIDMGPERLIAMFDGSKLSIIKAYNHFLELIVSTIDECFASFIKQLPVPLLSEESQDQDLLSLIDKFNVELSVIANLGYFNDKEKRQLEFVSCYFNGESLDEIGTKNHLTAERARQIIKMVSIHSKILKGESNFYLAQHFNDVLDDYKSKYLNNDLITPFLEDEGILLDAELNKLSFIGLEVLKLQLNNQDRYFLLDQELGQMRVYINTFIQFAKYSFAEKNLDTYHREFILYYKKEAKKYYVQALAEDRSLFKQILDSSFIQCRYSEDFEEDLYSIDWNLLASMDLKVARILLENEDQMTLEEIFEEYNDRNEYYGEEKLEGLGNLYVRTTEYVKNIRNGVWIYSEEEIDNGENTQSIISNHLIAKNGFANFDEINLHLLEKGRKYAPNSLRAFILMVAVVAKKDKNLFVHKQYVDKVSFELQAKRNSMIGAKVLPIIKDHLLSLNNDVSTKDFVLEVKENIIEEGISQTRNINVQYYLDLLANNDVLNIEDGNIVVSTIDRSKLERVKYRDEPAYREAIRNEAVVLLKENENEPIKVTDLWEKLSHLFPKDIAKNNFYKIFEKSDLFTKEITEKNRAAYILNMGLLPQPQPLTEVALNPDDLASDFVLQPIGKEVEPIASYAWDEAALFEFIRRDLSVKHASQNWDFDYGFDRFKSILIGKDSYHDHSNSWGNSILKSLGRVLMNMSDFFDRDTCMQRLSLSFESYLKILLDDNSSLGLGAIIKDDSTLNTLKEYKFSYQKYELNKTLLDFSKKLNSLLYFRNIYAHDPNSDKVNISLVDHVKNIMDFISLYIFVASALKIDTAR
ncbi:hypothetical protein [Sphingobacterium siyangense]